MLDSQELARRFNEDEAVWKCYSLKRDLRLRLNLKSSLPDEVQDMLDWLDAERECRAVRAVGILLHSK
jgi:hypothetical protein